MEANKTKGVKTITITNEVREKLAELAYKNGVSESSLIEEALIKYTFKTYK